MIDKDLAKTLWCPFRDAPSMVFEESMDGVVEDYHPVGALLTASVLKTHYETHGKLIAVAAINRIDGGEPYEKTLCQTDKCNNWRTLNGGNQGFCALLEDNRHYAKSAMPDDAAMKSRSCTFAKAVTIYRREWTDTNGMLHGQSITAVGTNQGDDGKPHPNCNCITKKCMAYYAPATNMGSCFAVDKSMQRF